MRLWHVDLLPLLPREQILGLHSEVCGLRGKGWGKKHSVVDYVFTHPYSWLFGYHAEVMREMKRRGYHVEPLWTVQNYRGKILQYDSSSFCAGTYQRYPEHNAAYLAECIANLAGKNVVINIERIL